MKRFEIVFTEDADKKEDVLEKFFLDFLTRYEKFKQGQQEDVLKKYVAIRDRGLSIRME